MAEQRVALVTGGTRGIGLSIAHALAKSGFALMVNGLEDDEGLASLERSLRERHKLQALCSGTDLQDPSAIDGLVAETVDKLGSLDVLINCAGIQHVAALDDFPVAKWDAIIAVNLSAAFHTTRLAVPYMKAQGWGRIVNIASAHGLVASPYKGPYVAAKHGLVGLTKVTALECGADGITCNAVCPGFVDSPIFQIQAAGLAAKLDRPEAEVIADQLESKQAIAELIPPDDIAALVAYLCSDSARAITGIALPIDGGWTAQ